MANEKYRQPNSDCIAFSTWTPTARTVKEGSRRAVPKSKGKVEIWFRRKFPFYHYVLERPFTLVEWQSWMKSSVGEKWNANYLGRV